MGEVSAWGQSWLRLAAMDVCEADRDFPVLLDRSLDHGLCGASGMIASIVWVPPAVEDGAHDSVSVNLQEFLATVLVNHAVILIRRWCATKAASENAFRHGRHTFLYGRAVS